MTRTDTDQIPAPPPPTTTTIASSSTSASTTAIASTPTSRTLQLPTTSTSTTTPTTIAPNATTGTTATRQPPLAVILSSHALARAIIVAKAKRRKLHSSELDSNILIRANAPSPYAHALINLNELLPLEVHRLRIAARAEAHKKDGVTFIRDGKILIRSKKNEGRAITITNKDDLNAFLAKQ